MEIFLLHCEYRLAFVVYSFVGFVLVFSLLLGYDFSQRERVHFFFLLRKMECGCTILATVKYPKLVYWKFVVMFLCLKQIL